MISSPDTAPATLGRVLHWAAGYDLLVWLLTRRSDRAFREQLASFAHLSAGESVLDIGCGTGTLAIVAKRQVGVTGKVFGIDASPAMIARATAKAAKAGIDVCFKHFVHAQPKSGFWRISTALVTSTRKMLWRCSRKRNCAASRADPWASAVSTSCGRWLW
jgi:SAM-dependent methyltransferase